MPKSKVGEIQSMPSGVARFLPAQWRWWCAILVLCGITAGAAYYRWFALGPPESDQPSAPLATAKPAPLSERSSRPVSDESPVSRFRNEAFTTAERLAADLPNSHHALCLLATVHRRYADPDEATRALQRAVALDARCADAYLSLGEMALEQGEYETAERYLREARQIDPDWDKVPLPLAEALLHTRKFSEAAQVLEAYLQRRPKSADGWLRLGQVYQQSGDYENAKRCNEAALDVDPNCAKAHYALGMALQKLGDLESAREQLEQFRRHKSRELAEIHAQRARLQDEHVAKKTLTHTYVTAGEIYSLHGRLADAERCWTRAAAMDANDIGSRERLCGLMIRQQRIDEAKRWAESICELAPDSPEYWLRLGNVCIQAGEPEQAEAPFRRVIAMAPDRADGHAGLAQVLMLPGKDHQQAVELAQKAVQLQPTADHYFVLAAACWTVEDWHGARKALEKAIQLNPADSRYREAYANLQSKLGQ